MIILATFNPSRRFSPLHVYPGFPLLIAVNNDILSSALTAVNTTKIFIYLLTAINILATIRTGEDILTPPDHRKECVV